MKNFVLGSLLTYFVLFSLGSFYVLERGGFRVRSC